jgi:hypothetical protein
LDKQESRDVPIFLVCLYVCVERRREGGGEEGRLCLLPLRFFFLEFGGFPDVHDRRAEEREAKRKG